MFAVEIYAAVRRFVFVEGKSRREAARVFGLSRDTISKMCRYSAPPGYLRSKAPERLKLGPLVPVIDAILEADKTAPPKQRHTAKRIFERLRIEHGYAGGYTAVKDYVRIARTRSREVFVPLAHPPGHAQVDFGECIGVIGGVRMKLHVFCFDGALRRLPNLCGLFFVVHRFEDGAIVVRVLPQHAPFRCVACHSKNCHQTSPARRAQSRLKCSRCSIGNRARPSRPS
jgi:transposase